MKIPRKSGPRAFTLIEVVISSMLMALILTSAYLCLNASIEGRKIVEPRADIFQQARVTMAMLAADLRGACPLPGDSAFLGMQRSLGEVEADNLDFATHNYSPRHPHEGDFCEVSYFVQQDAQSGRCSLWRRRNPALAPDPMSGGRRELIAGDILGVRFEYSDGTDWYDNWGEVQGKAKAENSQRQANNLQGLPEAVRITLMLDTDPGAKPDPQTGKRAVAKPMAFQTVAYLNLAEASQDNAENSGDNATQNSGASTGATQSGGGH
ncbi:MAG: prepilin-type N-terminal cleavage/methylation domain-containing protein [Verrucomicrobiota bacterium]|jgi:prepilin-type N-terminal cleavage/methylation domain-containing protein